MNCLWGKAKGRQIGKRPFAMAAFEPQHPGAEDADKGTEVVLDDEPEGSSSSLMALEGMF